MLRVMLVALSILLVSSALAGKPSGPLTEDALIYRGATTLVDVIITADGTNACSVVIRDGINNDATAISGAFTVAAGEILGGVVGLSWPVSVGLYADLTTAGTCTYVVSRGAP